jgi:SNF2 family DNA or RNA helicase
LDKERYPLQAQVIEQLSKHAQIALESAGKVVPILYTISLILRKRQANVWPAGINFKDVDGNVIFSVGDEVTESMKLDMLCDNTCDPDSDEDCSEGMIPEMVMAGQRVVVFSQFKEPLKALQERLAARGISVARFDGDTPENERQIIKTDFDRKYCDEEGYEKKFDVVLCNFRTGGVGLNFTGATQMIILDEEWNPGKNEQAYGRIDRIGQTEETTVHVLRMEKTVDDWMAQLNQEKKDMIDGFESEAKLSESMLQALKDGDM